MIFLSDGSILDVVPANQTILNFNLTRTPFSERLLVQIKNAFGWAEAPELDDQTGFGL